MNIEKKRVVRCRKCNNYELERNIFCRICGSKIHSIYQQNVESIGPLILLAFGVIWPWFLLFRNHNPTIALIILPTVFISIVISRKLFLFLEWIIWYRTPLLLKIKWTATEVRRLSIKDKEFNNLVTLLKSTTTLSTYDRNIGLLINSVGSDIEENSKVIGHLRKAKNWYRLNNKIIEQSISKDEYNKRLSLLDDMIHSLINTNRNVKYIDIQRRYEPTINKMIEEIEHTEAINEVEEATKNMY